MNLKTIVLLLTAPFWLPLLLTVLILAIPFIAFLPLTDEQCIEDGIVPAHRRYDQDFIARVRERAMGGEG